MPPNSKKVKREESEQEREKERKELEIFKFKLRLIYEDDLLVKGCKNAKEWKNLMGFRPGSGVSSKIQRLNLTLPSGWDVQDISRADGNIVNMDYFPVRIDRMPKVNEKEMSPLAFFEHVRKNLDDFIDPNTGVKFRPIDTVRVGDKLKGETELWNSNNPYLAVLSIKIPLMGPYFNDGSVICSNYDAYEGYGSEESEWIFTTLQSPVDGSHPVSGNREFGYVKNSDGSYTFYTRAVDRVKLDWITDAGSLLFGIAFSASDRLWSSFQKGIEDFVKTHSGEARAESSKNVRPDWSTVREVMEGKKTVEDIVCKES